MTVLTTVAAARAASTENLQLRLDEEQTNLLLAGDLSELGGVASLDILVSRDLQAALLAICAALPRLVRLRVRGAHLRVGTLPHQISALSTLEELALTSCGLHTLPPTLRELTSLRRLDLSAQGFATFPVEITALRALVELRLSNAGRIAQLPDELALMNNLRVLDLSHTLRFDPPSEDTGDPLMDDLLDETPGRPVPAVLGRMHELAELNLSHCHIGDLGPLSTAYGLRALDVSGGDFADLTPISRLPMLESLTLDMCYQVRDLSALGTLPLKSLRIQSNHYLSSVAALRDLTTLESLDLRHSDEIADFHTLLDHPTLTDVEGPDALVALWERRGEELPDATQLRTALRAAAPAGAVASVEPVLADLARLAIATQGGRTSVNRLAALFDVDSEGETLVELDELDPVVAGYARELRSETLIALVRAAYASQEHSLRVTLIALEEIARRGDEAAQLEFIDILEQAHTYYDAGHRAWAGDVYDEIVDEVLPGFRPVPLARLLVRFGTYDYLISDDLGRLLAPALRGPLPAELQAELLELLRSEATEGGYGLDQWTDLVAELSEVDLPPSVLRGLSAIRAAQLAAAASAESDVDADVLDEIGAGDEGEDDGADPSEADRKRLAAEDLGLPELLRILAELPEPKPLPDGETDLSDPVASAVQNRLVAALSAGDYDDARSVAWAYANVIDTVRHSERVREAVVSMVLMSAVVNGDDDLAERAVSWVPANINLPNLAYNLACYHATHGRGEPLYDAVRHARRLGKPRDQFLADSDFAAVRLDPGFIEALAGPR